MIHEPPIDELVKKVGSKYALCVIASKRARQILDHNQTLLVQDATAEKPLSIAANEIYSGKVSATKF